jgi:ABC-type phosphate/phosphonate transport system substrate-binding protein
LNRKIGGAVCIVMLVAGCSAGSSAPTPTALAVTQAPTATSLPPFPTVAQPGTDDNPLVVMLVDPEAGGSAPDLQSLSNAMTQVAGLAVDVRWTETYAGALDALCRGEAVIAQMSASSYLAAREADCGEAIYQIERDGSRVVEASLVVPMGGASALSGLAELSLCRISGADNGAWIAALLTLQAGGIDPLSQMGPVVDASSQADVVSLFAEGSCAGAVFVEPVEDDLLELVHELQALPPIPNDLIVIDDQLDVESRAVLVDALDEQQQNIAGLLGADALAPVDTGSLASFEALFEAADVDVLALAR